MQSSVVKSVVIKWMHVDLSLFSCHANLDV